LRSVQDSVDPIIGHLLDEVQVSMHRIESMCLAAKQRQANENTSQTPLGVAFGADKLAVAQSRKRTNREAPARVRGERR